MSMLLKSKFKRLYILQKLLFNFHNYNFKTKVKYTSVFLNQLHDEQVVLEVGRCSRKASKYAKSLSYDA